MINVIYINLCTILVLEKKQCCILFVPNFFDNPRETFQVVGTL